MKPTLLIFLTFLLFSCHLIHDYTTFAQTVDDQNIEEFDSLTQEQLDRVRGLKMFFQHASIGENINDGLTDLANQDSTKYGLQREASDDVTHLFSWLESNNGWADYYLGNPPTNEKIDTFKQSITSATVGNTINIAMMKLCYIDINDYTTSQLQFDAYREMMQEIESQSPNVIFFWWTMPITTTSDTFRNNFNNLVRQHCKDNDKWLYDIAAIESHDPSGNHQTNANGEYLYAGYTDDGGHLNADGRLRAAKLMWFMLCHAAAAPTNK